MKDLYIMAVVLRKKIVGSDMINKTGVETKEKLVKHNHPRLRIKEINENCPPPAKPICVGSCK
jgi:hypothetical protein